MVSIETGKPDGDEPVEGREAGLYFRKEKKKVRREGPRRQINRPTASRRCLGNYDRGSNGEGRKQLK